MISGGGGMADRNEVEVIYFAIAIDVAVFDIAADVIAEFLPWGVLHFGFIHEQPFCDQHPMFARGWCRRATASGWRHNPALPI